ncbi:MAG: hypothetical protein V3V14_01615 [Saprospiraceae bacterium]
MRIKFFKPSILLYGCLVFIACHNQYTASPTIDIVNPSGIEVHPLNYDLVLEAVIQDDENLESYAIKITTEKGLVVFDNKSNIDGFYHKIKYRFDISDTKASKINILIEAKDIENNKTTKKIVIETTE